MFFESRTARCVLQVVVQDVSDKSGSGLVLQDVAAPASLCMDVIRDYSKYKDVVPKGADTLLSLLLEKSCR